MKQQHVNCTLNAVVDIIFEKRTVSPRCQNSDFFQTYQAEILRQIVKPQVNHLGTEHVSQISSHKSFTVTAGLNVLRIWTQHGGTVAN